MPTLIQWTAGAFSDLDRLEAFLYGKNPQAAEAAIDAILAAIGDLRDFPKIGRSMDSEDDAIPHRELIVPFGSGGYLVLYVYDGRTVVIHRIRHQLEVGY